MRLSWNEIGTRAAAFADKWKDSGYEKGETQTFYNEFFDVFGITRQSVGRYEEHVTKRDKSSGYIDLLCPGTLIVEQKSAGRDMEKAKGQVREYFDALPEHDKPRYILVSDFQTFELKDLAERETIKFKLSELPQHVQSFGFIVGVHRRTFRDQDPANIKAAELIGKLHDALDKSGYRGHHLEQFLVRIVFCLFADDTGIFDTRDMFLDFIEGRTSEDGSDVGARLIELFQVLNTPVHERQAARDEDLIRFPYINGDLFDSPLSIPAFDSAMRNALIDACYFDWSNISPAIFGALFQSVMDPVERRASGAHYTTEKNILKVIEPMFMDDLRAEFNHLKTRKDSRRIADLRRFQERLGQIRLFDPACGCGNFLIIAYRELRELEIDVLNEITDRQKDISDIASRIDVDQFYGIETIKFPALIAETALWMMDHIMNSRLSMEFGRTYRRIPLERSPHIHVGNALETDWNDLLPARECSYVFGNPPFVGHQWRSKEQQSDMARIWGKAGQVNRLDYVTCWFKVAALYAEENRDIEIAFVSTNSITQGEQCGILWPVLFGHDMTIRFAHRTFQWSSEVRGKAAVHCVIIGLTYSSETKRTIYDYEHVKADPYAVPVKRINGYLIDGPQYAVPARSSPPEGRIKMHKGSQPTDGARLKLPEGGYRKFSNLILDTDDRDNLLATDPNCEKWLKPFVGSAELISGKWRWCLWLKNASPSELRASKPMVERLERVRTGRLQSPTASVRDYATYPTLFTQDRQPDKEYLAVPEVSSEIREYIPIDVLPASVIASNKLQIIPGAPIEYFGILTSEMHMAWIRTVAGRLKSDFSYSPAVYNSFPWPDTDRVAGRDLSSLSKAVLDARAEHKGASLADLYDPVLMPPNLRKAHQALDRAVDRLYRKQGFNSERERIEHLFMLYEKAR